MRQYLRRRGILVRYFGTQVPVLQVQSIELSIYLDDMYQLLVLHMFKELILFNFVLGRCIVQFLSRLIRET